MSTPTRLKLTIAYDGRPFRGWQSQRTGDAVQDRVEQAFLKLCQHRIVVHGAGRTDAGVHAVAQVAHVDVPEDRFPVHRWAGALNAHLPPEIRITKVSLAGRRFHARFDARGKIYRYRIWNAPFQHPLELGRTWHIPGELDLPQLCSAAALIEGTHDFAGFAANRGQKEGQTVRTIDHVVIRSAGPLLTLRFHGNGFLYKMVRLLTGTLVRCAQHRADSQTILDLLAGRGATKTSFAAPAAGLYLDRVLY